MRNKRSRVALAGVLSLVFSVTAGLMVGGVADAAKKGKKKAPKSKTISATGNAGAVPNGPSSNLVSPVPFKGTATIGGKAKGKVIADIDVTLSASAIAAAGSTNALGDLVVRITAPNGATTGVVFGGGGAGSVSGSLISNLTVSDETPVQTCGSGDPATPPPPPCGDPDALLTSPFTGTAQPSGLLDVLNESSAKGTYTLTAFDRDGTPAGDSGTSTITGWSIKVKAVSPRV
jgi:hypothetical protein